MIYSYKTYEESGPYGVTKTFRNTEENDATRLGIVNDVSYVHVPDYITLPEQPSEIDFKEAALTTEIKNELKTQAYAKVKKDLLRNHLEEEIGDIHDMLADCMKMTEFNIMLSTRLAADYLGVEPMSQETKDQYSQRISTFLGNVDSGEVNLRGNYDSIDGMFERMMERYSRIQDIVNQDYIELLKQVGLED